MVAALISVATGLVASLLYSLATVTGLSARWHWRARWHRRIWSYSLRRKSESLIILSSRTSVEPSETPRCSASEVRALVKITELLRGYRSQSYFRVNTDVSGDELRDKNLIILGTGKANAISSQALASLSLPGVQIDPAARRIVLEGQEYLPEYDPINGSLVNDYALVVRSANPFRHYQSTPRLLLMFMGLHGIGTEGAVMAAIDRTPLLQMVKQVDGENFAALIKVRVSGFLVTHTRVEKVVLIES